MIARPRALSLRDKMFASQEAASPDTMSGVPSNLGWPCEARGLSFPGPWERHYFPTPVSLARGRAVLIGDWSAAISSPWKTSIPEGRLLGTQEVSGTLFGGSLKFTRRPRPLPPRGYARGKDGLQQRQSLDSRRHRAVRGWTGAVRSRELLPSASRSCHLPGTDF